MSRFVSLPSTHSSYPGVPRRSRAGRGAQQGDGFFSSLGKVLKSAPILSTGAFFLPGVGKLAAPILASQGLGKGGKRRSRPSQNGGLNLKKLGKAVLKSGIVGEAIGLKNPKAGKLAKAVGLGKGKGKKGGKKK